MCIYMHICIHKKYIYIYSYTVALYTYHLQINCVFMHAIFPLPLYL